MPSLVPDVFPHQIAGLASTIGGPEPDFVSQVAYNTPFSLGAFHDTYRGPNAPRQVPPQTHALPIQQTSRTLGFGLIDRALRRVLG